MDHESNIGRYRSMFVASPCEMHGQVKTIVQAGRRRGKAFPTLDMATRVLVQFEIDQGADAKLATQPAPVGH
jgi:hypothetical protein